LLFQLRECTDPPSTLVPILEFSNLQRPKTDMVSNYLRWFCFIWRFMPSGFILEWQL